MSASPTRGTQAPSRPVQHEAFARLLHAAPAELGDQAETFVAWASAHRLAPYAWYLAKSADPDLAKKLEPATARARARELERAAWLSELLRALSKAGVHPVVFKGLGVAHWFYPSPGLRPLGDVDLLFRESELDRALAAMKTLGFVTDARPAVAEFNRTVNYNIPLRHPKHGLLEAHFALYEDCPDALTQRLIARSTPGRVYDTEVWVPSADDLFLVLATHFGTSLPGKSFVWLLDLVLIGRGLRHADWMMLARTAHATGTQIFVVAALACLEDLWGVELDFGWAARELQPKLTFLEHRAIAGLRKAMVQARPFGNALCYSRRMSGRPTRRGPIWVKELLWPHRGEVCLSLGIEYSPTTFWWHRSRHALLSAMRRLGKLRGSLAGRSTNRVD